MAICVIIVFPTRDVTRTDSSVPSQCQNSKNVLQVPEVPRDAILSDLMWVA